MNESIAVDRIKVAALLFAYRALLDALFVWYLASYWRYMGYEVDFDPVNFVLSVVQLGFVALFVPSKLERPSDLLLTFFLILVVLPFQTYSSFAGGSFSQMWAAFLAALPFVVVRMTPSLRFPGIRGGEFLFSGIAYLGIAICMIYTIAQGGLGQFNLDPTKIYDYRDAQKEVIQSGLAAYLINWVFKILVPFLIVVRLSKKDYVSVVLLLASAVLFFGMSNHKTTIVFPILVVGLYALLRSWPRSSMIMVGFGSLFLMCAALGWLFDVHYLAGILFRRAVFTAAMNFADYETFFSHRGFVFWTNSVFSSFAEYEYWDSPGHVIGDWRGTESNANSGFVASGYMHAGWVGVAVYAALGGVFVKILDSVSSSKSLATVGAAVSAPMLHVFLNVDFLIGLSTHGLGLLVIAAYLAFGESAHSERIVVSNDPRPYVRTSNG